MRKREHKLGRSALVVSCTILSVVGVSRGSVAVDQDHKPASIGIVQRQPPHKLLRNKGKIKSRHPFDIYEDQLDALKQLSLENCMHDGAGSMSAYERDGPGSDRRIYR